MCFVIQMRKKIGKKNIFNDDILSQTNKANLPFRQKLQLKRHFDDIGRKSPFTNPRNASNRFINKSDKEYNEYLILLYDSNHYDLPIWKMERLEALNLKFQKKREVIIKKC